MNRSGNTRGTSSHLSQYSFPKIRPTAFSRPFPPLSRPSPLLRATGVVSLEQRGGVERRLWGFEHVGERRMRGVRLARFVLSLQAFRFGSRFLVLHSKRPRLSAFHFGGLLLMPAREAGGRKLAGTAR